MMSTARRFLGIVNPRGGAGRAAQVVREVTSLLSAAGVELVTRETEYAGHATELVRSASLGDVDGICVFGGDGTTHEVVGGLMERPDAVSIPLGLIPAGTGNTLHHHLACGDPRQAVQRVVSGCTRPLDVLRVTMTDQVTYSVNIVGWAAIADINRRAERLRFLGKRRYSVAALIQIGFPRPRRATLELDAETICDEFLFVLVCNTKSTGTGMLLAPHAEVDDGLLDVVTLRNTSRWQTLRLFRKVFDGSHLSLPDVECRQVRSLRIACEEASELNIDGEMKGAAPCTVEVLPQALRVFC